jgi:hypothetical protein
MSRIGWRSDSNDRARFLDAVRGGEHRGATQTMADQNGRGAIHGAQVVCGGDQVVDIGGEMRVGEFALAGA